MQETLRAGLCLISQINRKVTSIDVSPVKQKKLRVTRYQFQLHHPERMVQ